jgi:hypothetical protein
VISGHRWTVFAIVEGEEVALSEALVGVED